MDQYQNLTEEQRSIVSLNTSMAALNLSGMPTPFFNISSSVEDADKKATTFSDTLSNISDIAGQLGGEAGSDTSQLLGGFGGGMVKFQRII